MQNQQARLNENQQKYAGFGVRLGAFLLDLLFVSIPLLFVRIPFFLLNLLSVDSFLTKQLLFCFNLCDILSYLLVVLYFSLLTYSSGQTIGKMLLNIKVVQAKEEKLGFFNLLYRETIGRFLSSFLFIGYFMVLIDPYKQGVHDVLSDTMVIYIPKNKRKLH